MDSQQNIESLPITNPSPLEQEIVKTKQCRKDIDLNIAAVRALPKSRESALALTKLQEAVMWLGMNLKRISDESGLGSNPYPNSKDPSNTKIEPTADGLKL